MSKNLSDWSSIEQSLTRLKQTELIELIHQLFNLSDDVALFLTSRFQPDQDRDSRLAPYRSLIEREFFPGNDVQPRLDFSAAR